MRLWLAPIICLQLSSLLACAQAAEVQGLPVKGLEAIARSGENLDPLGWKQRKQDVQQILDEPKYDFEKVGYRVGSLQVMADTLNPTMSLLRPQAPEPESGFGSETLNWTHGILSTDGDQAELLDQSDVIEQLQFQELIRSDDFDPSSMIPGWMNPEQVFAAPVDPLIREYTLAPPDPTAAPPKIKSLWREYADWAHSGFIGWTERLELGGSFLEGNTNQEAFNTAARFSRETTFITTQINIGGNHAQSKQTITQNRWFADTTTDFKRKGNWLYFVRSLHEFDQFTNLDYRGTASFGMGYRFYNEPNRKLIVRYGPGVTQEVFHSPRVIRTSPDLFAEFESIWPIGPRVILEEKATLHPNITNFGMLRVLNTTGFLIPLDDQKRWNLKVGFRFEYNGRPNADRQPSDFATNVNIVYSRK